MTNKFDVFMQQLQYDMFTKGREMGIPYDEIHDDFSPIVNYYGSEIYGQGASHAVAKMLKNKYHIDFSLYVFQADALASSKMSAAVPVTEDVASEEGKETPLPEEGVPPLDVPSKND